MVQVFKDLGAYVAVCIAYVRVVMISAVDKVIGSTCIVGTTFCVTLSLK